MSIERKLLKQSARLLGALACAVVLAACISPDLEPPGAADKDLPGNPGATDHGADEQARKAQPRGDAGVTGATTSTGAMPAITPGTNMAAAGQGAKPATGAMTPPSAAGSGAPRVPSDPNRDADADAGTQTP